MKRIIMVLAICALAVPLCAATSDLEIIKRVTRPGFGVFPVVYDISVTNYGPDAAGAIAVTDTLTPGTYFDIDFQIGPPPAPWVCTFTPVSEPATSVTCEHPGPLAVGATVSLPVALWVPDGLSENCAAVRSLAGSDPAAANNTSCTCTTKPECRDISIDISTGTRNGQMLNPGDSDDDWVVISTPSGSGVNAPAKVVGKYHSGFVSADPANWISAANPQPQDQGDYAYELKFSLGGKRYLDCGLSMDYASDNDITFFLDGAPLAQTVNAGSSAFTKLRPRRRNVFPAGQHTLRAQVHNSGGPTSLIVKGTFFCTCFFFIDFIQDPPPSDPYAPIPVSNPVAKKSF